MYKYRSIAAELREHTYRIFTHNELMFSSPSAFNDPFEAKPQVRFAGTRNRIHRYIEWLVRRHKWNGSPAERLIRNRELESVFKSNPKAEFERTLWELLNDYGVLSLSEDALHPLMWSHYADSHRGICIEFDAAQHFFQYARKVNYELDYPSIDPMSHLPEEVNEIAILTKADFWKYEKEWRVIFPKMTDQEKKEGIAKTNNPLGKHLYGLHNGPGIYTFPPDAISAVILGAKVSVRDAEELIALLKNIRPDIYIERAALHPSAFKLERTAI
ncbi:MAG: DUF2971 domain-containing protein [Proteobacteria bacterium]|nr:DUF2971 domain-containing protein [Pseudomonadota bacterium]